MNPASHSHAVGYSRTYRAIEYASIAAFMALQAHLHWALGGAYADSWWMLPASLVLGLLAADWVSGVVHWAGDTWGTAEWAIIGPALIRPFREHHVDQKGLTRHDFVELNGSNCLVSVPVLVMAALGLEIGERFVGGTTTAFLSAFLAWMTLWVFFTNMFHQWAHREPAENNALIRWLQRRRLILSPEAHAIHHRPPHLGHYCITTGWLNPVLERVDFYRRAERLVSGVTGAQPRA